eukprot:5604646-Pyramimonas_sp.AAC.1
MEAPAKPELRVVHVELAPELLSASVASPRQREALVQMLHRLLGLVGLLRLPAPQRLRGPLEILIWAPIRLRRDFLRRCSSLRWPPPMA